MPTGTTTANKAAGRPTETSLVLYSNNTEMNMQQPKSDVLQSSVRTQAGVCSDASMDRALLKPRFSSCATRDLSKWQQLACSVQANWNHLHNTCLPSQFICGQFKQVCVILSQPDVKSPWALINDPQSCAIISHKAHQSQTFSTRLYCFLYMKKQHRQMHTLSKWCLPALRMQLLRLKTGSVVRAMLSCSGRENLVLY